MAEFFDPVVFEFPDWQAKTVVETDVDFIKKCDLLVSNMWKFGAGSIMEMVYAKIAQKSVILLTTKELLGPWLEYHSNMVVFSEEELYQAISDFIDDYHAKEVD